MLPPFLLSKDNRKEKAVAFEKGYEGCDDPYDLGWKHGHEDAGGPWKYRPGIRLTPEEFQEYKEGYKDARRGWD